MRIGSAFLVIALALCISASRAEAVTPAESFVSGNIQVGLAILGNKHLSETQRKTEFATFLLGVIDMKRIAEFTLGRYASTASPADKDAFARAFQDYAVAVYQSYFAKYSGQSLTVTRSTERAPDDFIVETNLVDPNNHSGQPPLEIDFRVRTDTAKPVIIDFGVAGIWIALSERDDFSAVLAEDHGNIAALIAHLHTIAAQY